MADASVRIAWDDLKRENYAQPADVELLLTGVLTDVTGANPLSQVLTASERDAIITRYLDAAGDQVRLWARRDFGYHENVWIYADGTGTNCIDLAQRGFWPLLKVTDLYIAGTQVTNLSGLLVFQSGLIMLSGNGTFPKRDNALRLQITWGFPSPPREIVDAQAMLAAARILEYIVSAKNVDGFGGVQIVQYGDLQLRQYQQGRFWQTIKSWREQAETVCRSYSAVQFRTLRTYDDADYGELIRAAR